MYNVLHVIGHIGRGGDTTVVLDVMKNMDCSKFHFDFITHKGAKEEIVKELRDAGSKVYIMDGDVRELGLINYYKSFLKALKQMSVSYDAIHVHTGMQSGVALAAARKAGIPKRICHSHVTAIQRKTSIIKKIIATPIFRYLYIKNSTVKVACSKDAGAFMYGKDSKFTVVYNAVDIAPYLDVTPQEIRKREQEIGAKEDDVLIGHVARMSEMKNQRFILGLARKMEDCSKLKFVMIGDGPDFPEIKTLAQNQSNIVLMGRRSDIPSLMKTFDCVILPSLPGEGFPVTMIEAQAAGCRCLISENVTKEVEVGLKLVKSIPLKKPDEWVEELKTIEKNRNYLQRNECAKRLIDMGFGKTEFVNNWIRLYEV